MKRQTQVMRLYAALKAGQVLTMASGRAVCGSYNTHKRIAELERLMWEDGDKESIVRGWRIVNGRRLRTWRLAK